MLRTVPSKEEDPLIKMEESADSLKTVLTEDTDDRMNTPLPLPMAPGLSTGSIVNDQGLSLVTYAFNPATSIRQSDAFAPVALKGVVLCLHGYGSHTQNQWFCSKKPGDVRTVYKDSTVETLVKSGFAVRTLDHQSFGRSQGLDGIQCTVPGQKSGAYFKRFDDLVDEAEQYITEVVMKEDMLKGLPIFLFGISMGGATTIKLAHRAPERYAGMLTFAPMCSLQKVRRASIWKCVQNRHVEPLIGLIACLSPKLPIAKTSPNTMFPELTKEYDDDPLCYQLATRVIVAKEFIDTTAEFMETDFFAGLRTPSATFHSVHDTLTDMEGTEALFAGSVNVQDKTFYRVGAGLDVDVKLWHNLLREPGCEMVLNKAMEWMNARCKAK